MMCADESLLYSRDKVGYGFVDYLFFVIEMKQDVEWMTSGMTTKKKWIQ